MQFKGLKNIPNIRNHTNQQLIGNMRDQNGTLQTDRQSIIDVFADFFEALYAERNATVDNKNAAIDVPSIHPVTITEVRTLLQKMGKALPATRFRASTHRDATCI